MSNPHDGWTPQTQEQEQPQMKKTFRVSQGEMWHREYVIWAETLDEAKKLYAQFLIDALGIPEEDLVYAKDPEYIEDIDDTIWFDENEVIE